MKKILCPVDFSETSENAIVYAAKMAKQMGGELCLFNVQVLADLSLSEILAGKETNTSAASRLLEERCDEVTKVFKINCYSEVAASLTSMLTPIGNVTRGFDLMVTGTKGEGDGFERFLGSHSYRMSLVAGIPVLIIPAGVGFSEINRVIFAVDYLHPDYTALVSATSLCRSLRCELTVVYVLEAYSRNSEIEIERINGLIASECSGIPLQFRTFYSTDLSQALDAACYRYEADLIALSRSSGSPKGLFKQGVVRKAAAKSDFPVLILPHIDN